MDEIAATTAVTKLTRYDHFESTDSLLAVVLESQHRLESEALRAFGDSLSGPPRQSSMVSSSSAQLGQ
jgi:hypothetical protein